MGVGMEEPVVNHLGHVALGNGVAQLLQVPPVSLDSSLIADERPFHVFHDQHVVAGEERVWNGALDARLVEQKRMETFKVAQLHAEVDFLASGAVKLVYQILQRQLHARFRMGKPHQRHHAPKQGQVAKGVLSHFRTLHLHGHPGAGLHRIRRQRLGYAVLARDAQRVRGDSCLVHLGDGGGPERLGFQHVEGLAPRVPVGGLQGFLHRGKRHGLHVGLQLLEGVGVLGRNDVAARGGDLAQLHEGGTQLLQQLSGRLGRQVREHVVLADDALDLAKALPDMLVLVAAHFAHDLRHFLERCHGCLLPLPAVDRLLLSACRGS